MSTARSWRVSVDFQRCRSANPDIDLPSVETPLPGVAPVRLPGLPTYPGPKTLTEFNAGSFTICSPASRRGWHAHPGTGAAGVDRQSTRYALLGPAGDEHQAI